MTHEEAAELIAKYALGYGNYDGRWFVFSHFDIIGFGNTLQEAYDDLRDEKKFPWPRFHPGDHVIWRDNEYIIGNKIPLEVPIRGSHYKYHLAGMLEPVLEKEIQEKK